MTTVRGRLIASLLIAAGMVLAGCATGEEWRTWKEHPTHFASGDHLSFSVKNTEGSRAKVGRTDIALARDEGWWGKAVTVSQDQILQR
jgi:hypothetical protein